MARKPPTRAQRNKQRLEDKLDRLRSDLPPEKRPVKRRPDIHPNDLYRWNYGRNNQR
jgi:hypothetical protein